MLKIAIIYYLSFLITQYFKVKGIDIEYRRDKALVQSLVIVGWLLYPLVLPLVALWCVIVELKRKAERYIEDTDRCRYSLNSGRTPRRYRHGQRK